MLPQPDDRAASGEDSVLGLERGAGLVGVGDLFHDALAIVRVDDALEQLTVPVIRPVAEQRLDLRADEACVGTVADGIDPGDQRQGVGQVAVLPVGVGELFLRAAMLGPARGLATCEPHSENGGEHGDRNRNHCRERDLLVQARDDDRNRDGSGGQDERGDSNERWARDERSRLHWTG